MGKCILFCAGEFDGLLSPIEHDDHLLAVDGGLAHTDSLSLTPDAVLGDFDSLGYIPPCGERFPVEKDDTDCMLAVRKALDEGFREIWIYGGLDGPRLDHTLANLQTLQFIADRGAVGYLIGTSYIATVVKNGTLTFSDRCRGIISLFCMGQDAADVTLTGLHYPLQNGMLTAGFPLGVSNRFTNTKATVTVKHGSLLVLFDKANGLPGR